jgi:hypothetical protein
MNTCLWSAVAFALSIIGGPQRGPLRFDQWHHAYAGAAVCAAGAAVHSRFVVRVGGAVLADDAVQHVYQRVNANLDIVSPLNVGYRLTLGTAVPVARLNRWLDSFVNRLLR